MNSKRNTFIFDMDGVILNSEPFWRQAQIGELAKLGHHISIEDCIHYTMGKRLQDISHQWIGLFGLSIPPKELEQRIMDSVITQIRLHGTANMGLLELLEHLKRQRFKIGMATSSSPSIINAVLQSLEIEEYFQLCCSADHEQRGKPYPDVYLTVAKGLGVFPEQCIVLEDSFTGVSAAKAANMYTIALPEDPKDPRFEIADKIVDILPEVIAHLPHIPH